MYINVPPTWVPLHYSRMNPLILFLSLKYLAPISAANISGNTEIIEFLSENDESSSSTGNLSASGGLSLVEEPITLSGSFFESSSRKRRRTGGSDKATKLINLYDDEEVQEKVKDAQKEVTRTHVPVVEKMDVKTFASMIPLLDLDEIRGHLVALGGEAKVPIKDTCGWNLLHEAVHTDNYEVAQILMTEFGFDPNAFDPIYTASQLKFLKGWWVHRNLKHRYRNISLKL